MNCNFAVVIDVQCVIARRFLNPGFRRQEKVVDQECRVRNVDDAVPIRVTADKARGIRPDECWGRRPQRGDALAEQVIQSGQARLETYSLAGPREGAVGVCGGEVEVFIEPILPPPTVLVLGCGHVGVAVAHLAKWLGFRVAVTDDRIEFCNPEWLPEADLYFPGTIPDALKEFEITDQTFVAAVTRGVKADTQALPHLLRSAAPYVGVIGSRRRWTIAVQELQGLGVPEELIRRARAPIGLRIGAETPREIALSILSEIVAFRQETDGGVMQWYPSSGTRE